MKLVFKLISLCLLSLPIELYAQQNSPSAVTPATQVAGDEKEPSINDFLAVEKEPLPLKLNKFLDTLQWSPALDSMQCPRQVLVRVLVSKEGKYLKHVSLVNVPELFDAEAARALPSLQFMPAVQNGKPITCWTDLSLVRKAPAPSKPKKGNR